jgi:CRP-like cAMP-binding protein
MLKDEKQYGMQTFRLARIGPGWVIGSYEMLSGEQAPGVTIAVDRCRLFYISFHDLEQLEKEKPMLILQLYKLLSKLEARRSDMHLGQFATLHNIMSSPSHNRPMTTRGILARQKP